MTGVQTCALPICFPVTIGAILKDLVRSQEVKNAGIYRIPEVDKIIDEHKKIVASKTKKENHMMFLWQLTNIYFWLNDK